MDNVNDPVVPVEHEESEAVFLKRVYRDFFETVQRQKYWIALFSFCVVLLVAIFSFLQTPYYRATTTLLIDSDMAQDPSEQKSLGNLDLQVAIIQSPEIIAKVIEQTNFTADSSVDSRVTLSEAFMKFLDVRSKKQSKTIDISFLSEKAETAALTANQIAQAYIEGKTTKSSGVVVDSVESLQSQLAQQIEKHNTVKNKIAELNRENPELGNENILADQIKYLNSEYVKADSRVMELRNTLSELEAIIKIGGNIQDHPYASSHPRVRQKIDRIRDTEIQLLEMEQEYRQMHPTFLKAQAKLKALRQSLDDERTQLIAELTAALKASEAMAQGIRQSMLELQAKEKDFSPAQLAYKNLLTEEASIVETIRLLNGQISKASIAGSVKQTPIEILSYAVPPLSPAIPDKPRNILMALFLSLLVSLGSIFFRHYFDQTLKKDEDVEWILRKPFLGHAPYVQVPKDSMDPVLKNEKEKIYFFNFFRLICANISFLLGAQTKASIVLTGSLPGEGKSFVCCHVARTFANEGKKTVLIDADFCHSTISKMFPREGERPGLHSYLMENAPVDAIIEETAYPNLFLIPSREAKFSAPYALRSKRMKEMLNVLKETFDVVIVDTPPVLVLNDAVAISELADMRVVVVEWGKTLIKSVLRTVSKIAPSDSALTGIILNKVKHWGKQYYYEHYYGARSGYFSRDVGTPKDATPQ
ncbi:MAG: GumC family protein [Candidatus Omnitrophota bacterium]|jgi:capsular exopolysaccharide synthesis family protein